MSITDSYHITTLGSLASSDLQPDIDGYVHLTVEAVMGGNWDAATEMDEDYAEEIAAQNRTATEASERAVAEWREQDA